jgi:hypothetical protein
MTDSRVYLAERIRQQTLHGNEHLDNSHCQGPVVVNKVDSNISVPRHVRVKYFGDKTD